MVPINPELVGSRAEAFFYGIIILLDKCQVFLRFAVKLILEMTDLPKAPIPVPRTALVGCMVSLSYYPFLRSAENFQGSTFRALLCLISKASMKSFD